MEVLSFLSLPKHYLQQSEQRLCISDKTSCCTFLKTFNFFGTLKPTNLEKVVGIAVEWCSMIAHLPSVYHTHSWRINTIQPEILVEIKFGGWAQNHHCKNICGFKFGSSVRDRHMYNIAIKNYWQILIWQLQRQTTKLPNLWLYGTYMGGAYLCCRYSASGKTRGVGFSYNNLLMRVNVHVEP